MHNPERHFNIAVSVMQGPPEACGATCGFDGFKDAMADPSHPCHQERRAWWEDWCANGGGVWDPTRCELTEINMSLEEVEMRHIKAGIVT